VKTPTRFIPQSADPDDPEVKAGSVSGRGPGSRWEPPTMETLQRLLPQFRFEGLVGCGGMGAVYKAIQLSLSRPVAVKVLPADLFEDSDANYAGRFRLEALTMARLSHPGIVSVFEAGEVGGLLYIVMEFVDGTDVARMICRAGPLAPALAANLLGQVCEALHHAHQCGVIHRDIKPANLLVTREGRIKIADFGLARHADLTRPELTRTHLALGTLGFIAPECLGRKAPPDGRADIYSLGATLYQMLTGAAPHGRWKLPSRTVGADPRFDEVIRRAMQADPAARYPSVMDLHRDLSSIVQGAVVGIDRLQGSSPIRPLWPWLAGFAAVLVAAALGSALIGHWNWPGPGWSKGKRTVTSLEDHVPGSLRQKIAEAGPGDTILFSSRLGGQTIQLSGGALTLAKDLTIDATSLPGGIRIAGQHSDHVFSVAPGVRAMLRGLTITNGFSHLGGGVANSGSLVMSDCLITGNEAGKDGGGVHCSGDGATVVLLNCTLTGNRALYAAGVWTGLGGAAYLTNCTLAGNQATCGGSAVLPYSGSEISLSACTVSGNRVLPCTTGPTNAGAVLVDGGTLRMSGSVVAGNFAPFSPDVVVLQGTLLPHGANLTSGDPKLAPLGNYGGRTPTMPTLPGSPALRAAAPDGPATDQRGVARPATGADLGAVQGEVKPNPSP
jgi:serine/threonine protein kinase